MPEFKRGAVALVVLPFSMYFLDLKQQTQDLRFQWLLLLQYLKKL